ncbi:MAG: hypothetical protein UX89_C0007G0018 [Parcubacteria group bacterium GW2011_GWA2_47_16]|nr:MAG: hypothetical protein UX89_C0007G0018 [Parcubacteria group bacterium GW2011_GWA2_47_16]
MFRHKTLTTLLLLAGVSLIGFLVYVNNDNARLNQNNPAVEWSMEIFDKIRTNYWSKISEEQLSNLYTLAIEKILNRPLLLQEKNREALKNLMNKELAALDEASGKKFVTSLATVVLYNLEPVGRNALYTSRDEAALRDQVKNVDLGRNLYETLGATNDASPEEIEKSYEVKKEELKKENTPEAKRKMEELSYAKEVLTVTDSKKAYDEAKIEPTVFGKTLSPEVYYVYISKFSPTTFDEFVKLLSDTSNKSSLKALLMDVRGNIGGAVDILPYFLGLFIGQNQYAYDFYHQENYNPNKTKLAKLPSLAKFKNIAMLTDDGTQSSAETMAATFKRFNTAIVVGKTTKGWGTIENTFPIETLIDPVERYSLFLVHSITLRDDSQPIEGRGVEPNVDITKPNWQKTLEDYISYKPLFNAVKIMADKKPEKI